MRDDLIGLSAFLAVADRRSFRAAGEALGVTPSAVSQTVRQLEERLGLQLFVRTTRSVTATEAGEHLHRALRPAFADVRTALESLNELRAHPAGVLRLNVTSIAEAFLGEGLLAEFLALYPDIKLDVSIDDTDSDIVREGFDAGVRLGEVVSEDMVAVGISPRERQVVVGSPKYLKRHGRPKHPRDLHAHACIGWRVYSSPAPYRWEFTEDGKDFSMAIDARVNTSEGRLMLNLARDGIGLALGMESSLRPFLERGELVMVLEKYCPSFPGFFLYYPSRTRIPPKLKALAAFLRKRRKA